MTQLYRLGVEHVYSNPFVLGDILASFFALPTGIGLIVILVSEENLLL